MKPYSVSLLIALALSWLAPAPTLAAHENSLHVISPYFSDGTWVFDDPSVGLVKEPFVMGIPEMIDALVLDLPNPDKGFHLLFSAQPFPNYQSKIVWVRQDGAGNWYRFEHSDQEGWICPSLFKYFDEAPKEIYLKANAQRER